MIEFTTGHNPTATKAKQMARRFKDGLPNNDESFRIDQAKPCDQLAGSYETANRADKFKQRTQLSQCICYSLARSLRMATAPRWNASTLLGI
jgi:hypothetical protein